jgi:hypothetical protein
VVVRGRSISGEEHLSLKVDELALSFNDMYWSEVHVIYTGEEVRDG